MSVLDDVGTLISKAAQITLPGIVAALAYAVYLWPPVPEDIIETAQLCSARGASNCPAQLPAPLKFPLKGESGPKAVEYTADARKPACNTSTMPLDRPKGLFDYQNPVEIQKILDKEIQIFKQCVQNENAQQGTEDALSKGINQIITQLSGELGKIDDAYQGYAASGNPLAGRYAGYLDERKQATYRWEAAAIQLQSASQERARRVIDLTRQAQILTDRQGDPGRLRPRQKFDDILAALGQHITGFTALAIAWGLILTPLSQSAFSVYYGLVSKYRWDYLRKDRGPPLEALMRIAKRLSSAA